jgi:UDP-N-acetylmuramyl pentapeptide synthase
MASFYENGARYAGLPQDHVLSFPDSIQAGEYLAGIVRAGDVVLVKGSQSMRMERVSVALLADSTKAGEVLVRQDEEWASR